MDIGDKQRSALTQLARRLMDQREARIVVEPLDRKSGFWFGGGNMAEGPDGVIYLTGRHRVAGDSRTGLDAGERGRELAIFRSDDRGQSFRKILSFSKQDLSYSGRRVLSIEGSCLLIRQSGVELYVSSEKDGLPYPPEWASYQKLGTGVWSVDLIRAPTVEDLSPRSIENLFESQVPEHLHVKDPVAYEGRRGETVLIFCTHPFSWTSSNNGMAVRPAGAEEFGDRVYGFFPRGFAWDVAMSRITGVLKVPPFGLFADSDPVTLYWYDGGESVRQLDEHILAVSRPRGYSCEELGGAAWGWDDRLPELHRLSPHLPLFVSPHGTGCSRYAQTMACREGIFAIWQQSQPDFSQPLVMHFLPVEEVQKVLES